MDKQKMGVLNWWEDEEKIQDAIQLAADNEVLLKEKLLQVVEPLKLAKKEGRYQVKRVEIFTSVTLSKEKWVRIIVGIEKWRINAVINYDLNGFLKGSVLTITTDLRLLVFSDDLDVPDRVIEVRDEYFHAGSVEKALDKVYSLFEELKKSSGKQYRKKVLEFEKFYFYRNSSWDTISESFLKKCLKQGIDLVYIFTAEGFGAQPPEYIQKETWEAWLDMSSIDFSNLEIEEIAKKYPINIWDRNYDEKEAEPEGFKNFMVSIGFSETEIARIVEENAQFDSGEADVSVDPKGFGFLLETQYEVKDYSSFIGKVAKEKSAFLTGNEQVLKEKNIENWVSVRVKTHYQKPLKIELNQEAIRRYLGSGLGSSGINASSRGVGDEIKWAVSKS